MAAATTAKAKVFSGLHGAGCRAEERAGWESDPAQSLLGQAGQRPWSTLVGAPGQSSRQGHTGVSPVSAGEPAPQMQHHCRGACRAVSEVSAGETHPGVSVPPT